MKKRIFIALIALLPLLATAQNRQDDLKQHIYTLANDTLRGREAGSPDALRAAKYIARQFQAMGLQPLYKDYLQPFQAYFGEGNNVIGVVEGNDPVQKHEFIVIGAHYDHLGIRNDSVVYNGADDNASGTAAVIEIARTLLSRRTELKRSVILVCFDGEEKGLYGSNRLVGKLSTVNDADNDASLLYNANDLNTFLPIENIKLMMSLDMVGWLKEGKSLRIVGTAMLRGGDVVMREVASRTGLNITTKDLDELPFVSTDSEPFARAGVPAFYVNTGLKSPYHKPEDDANRIDYVGLDHIVSYLAEATITLANADKLEASGRIARKHASKLPIFEAGLSAGFGRNSLVLPDAGFTSHSLLGFHGGLTARFNIKHVAIELGAYYNQARSRLPIANGTYDSTCSFSQGAITVPLSVQLQTNNPMTDFFVGGGAYYSHILNTRVDNTLIQNNMHWAVVPDQWGLQWNFGVRITRVIVSVASFYQMNKQFIDDESQIDPPLVKAPKTRNINLLCTVTYLF